MLQLDQLQIKEFFYHLLHENLAEAGENWLDKSLKVVEKSQQNKDLFTLFSMAPRFVGKKSLDLSNIRDENSILCSFNSTNLTTDQAARILLLLTSYQGDFASFSKNAETLFSAADVQELVALYTALPLFPNPEKFILRAIEGIRTNISVIFDKIALENPYPSEHLPESAWNQMVLKAFFINRPIYKIYNFDQRRNYTLANMLSDFAHERWAAGRKVSPELWRATVPFIEGQIFLDIQKLIQSDYKLDKEAGALALYEYTREEPEKYFKEFKELKNQIEHKTLSWEILGKKFEDESQV